jgi:hypothetical protein
MAADPGHAARLGNPDRDVYPLLRPAHSHDGPEVRLVRNRLLSSNMLGSAFALGRSAGSYPLAFNNFFMRWTTKTLLR